MITDDLTGMDFILLDATKLKPRKVKIAFKQNLMYR